MSDDKLVLDTANPDLGFRRFLKVGGRIIDVTTLGEPLTIRPAGTGRKVFAIAELGRVEVFASFKTFEDELAARLGGGTTLLTFTARGAFDEADATVTARYIAVTVRGP
jgi:hypothetical protein